MSIINFFHHLFNPHCPDCKEELEESKICKSCNTLLSMLDIANFEKKQLLEKLLHKDEPIPQPEINYEELKPKNIPWQVRRQMLEQEDRIKAKLMKEVPKSSIEDLEKELNIVEKKREENG